MGLFLRLELGSTLLIFSGAIVVALPGDGAVVLGVK